MPAPDTSAQSEWRRAISIKGSGLQRATAAPPVQARRRVTERGKRTRVGGKAMLLREGRNKEEK